MADKKISGLDPADALTGAELIELVQGGVNVRGTLVDVAAWVREGIASIGVQYISETGSVTDSDPGGGLLKWNNPTQASATELYLDDTSADGVGMTAWWAALDAGGFCYLQHPTDQDTWQIWEVAAVTDASGYVKLAVTLLAAGDAFADGADMLVTMEQGTGTSTGMTNPMTTPGDLIVGGVLGAPARLGKGSDGQVLRMVGGAQAYAYPLQVIAVAISDETTNLTTGTAKLTIRIPYAYTLVAVRASVSTAQTAGSVLTFDINEAGVSILSTKLTIDNSEKTSTTAAIPAVILDSSLADDAEVTFDIDQVGTALAKGAKIYLIGYPTP